MSRTIEALKRRVRRMEDRKGNIPVEDRFWIEGMKEMGATEEELEEARTEYYTWADFAREWWAGAEADIEEARRRAREQEETAQ